jgi:hypothetical protein
MEAHVRRAVAYIAGRLIIREDAEAIHEPATGRSYSMRGTAKDSYVKVYDHSCGCHISGNFYGLTYSLYHDGTSAHIELKITDNRFSGYEFASASQFNGNVSDRSITLYDFKDGNFYHFSI